jgi:hypothetical protein
MAQVRPRFAIPLLLCLTTATPAGATATLEPQGSLLPMLYQELAARASLSAAADQAAPAVPVRDGAVDLDGRLAEPLWREALVWELPFERRVKVNGPARERTLFLMALTPTDVAFAFVCLDGDIRRLRATLADRDADLSKSDHVYVALDTFGDERHAYQVYVNPLNVQADSLLEDRGTEDRSFDFLWESASRLYPDGWVVEIRIPLKYLRHGSRGEAPAAWRVGPGRSYPRDFQYLFWPAHFDPDRNCSLCQYPEVDVELPRSPGGALQLIPFTTGLLEEGTGRKDDRNAEAGFDLKYQPSPSWTLDATVFPDFSQVETDAFQITTNLRFQPFFEEKRPFFLERSDLFRSPLRVVHTRTLLDPELGARATGKAGRHSFAFLHARDEVTFLLFPGPLTSSSTLLEDEPSDNTLLRYRYDLGERSKVGLLYTDRAYDGGHNRVLSFDGRWGLGREFLLEAQAVGSRTAYPRSLADRFGQGVDSLTGNAAWLKLSHNGRTWDHRWELDVRSDDLRTDLGFLQQVGIKKLTATEWYHHWPESGPVKDWGIFFEGFHTVGDSETLEGETWIGGNATLPGDTYLDLGYVWRQDRVSHGLLPTGHVLFIWRSSPAAWFAASGRVRFGDTVDFTLEEVADWRSVSLTQEWRLWRRLFLSYAVSFNELAQRDLLQDSLVQTLRAEWQILPGLGFRQIAQLRRNRFPDPRFTARGFPSEGSLSELQSLLRYRLNYGTALYAGVFVREDLEPAERTDRGAFLKLTYLFNL